MNIRSLALITMIFSLLLVAGCGGGGGNNNGGGGGGGAAPGGAVNGAVAGTTVIAVDDTGSIVASDDTSDRPVDVDTDNDMVPDAYSFQLAGIPLNTAIRIYLIHDGATYPMYYDSEPDGMVDTNVFMLTAETTVDLGFVDIAVPGMEGRSIPQFNPTENMEVAAGILDPVIPAGINEPDTSGLTLNQLIDRGLDALADGWVLGARTYFEEAVNVAGGSTANNADTARFMFALTRIAALGFDTLSDQDSSDMNRLGDILDRLGVANDDFRANWDLIDIAEPMPADSPTGNEYQTFLYDVVRPELIGAVDNLDAISAGFNKNWNDFISGSQTESDYGDVLFLRGSYKSMLASIAMQMAYDLDADIDEIHNSNHDLDLNNNITVENFVTNNTVFLGLADTTKLMEAKNYLTASALDDFDAAIDEIVAETDDQLDDLVTIDMIGDPTLAKQKIAQVKESILNGATTVGQGMLDLRHFFDDGVDFRSPSDLLPPFNGNKVAGLFPDPTFDQVILQPDMNEDTNPPDGIPDILQ